MYTPVKMSFFDIPDPVERERVVREYEQMKREIQERQEKRKISGQYRNRTLQETFHPVVKAQTDMAEKIVKSLQENYPNKKEKIPFPSKTEEMSSDHELGPLESAYRNRYMSRADDIDTSFGINFLSNGEAYIASTPITVEDDDIIIYNEVYRGTPGLWSLITERKKENLQGKYDENDLTEYEGILRQTNTLHQDFNPNSAYPRSNGSWKWKYILSPIWEKLKEENDDEKSGSGLIIKEYGRIWKVKRHSLKGYRKLNDGVYSRNGKIFYKLL